MHALACPHCATGTKTIVFIWGKDGKQPVVLGKYSSCDCTLSQTDRLALFSKAAKEAATV